MIANIPRMPHEGAVADRSVPRYQREASLPFLCVPACLNMICVRRGYPAVPQTDIAKRLGLVIPRRLTETYGFADVSDDPSRWGVRADTSESGICRFLGDCTPPLYHVFTRWQEVPMSSQLDFIAAHIEKGNDIAVGFYASGVYDGAGSVGHLALIDAIDTRSEMVRLIDPEVGADGGVTVNWSRLFDGIMAAHDGYWLFGNNAALLAPEFAS